MPRSSLSRIRCFSRSEISPSVSVAPSSSSHVISSWMMVWRVPRGGGRGRDVSRWRERGGRGRRGPGGGVCWGGLKRWWRRGEAVVLRGAGGLVWDGKWTGSEDSNKVCETSGMGGGDGGLTGGGGEGGLDGRGLRRGGLGCGWRPLIWI